MDGHVPKLEAHFVIIVVDLLGGHEADRCCPLGVEQDKHAGEAVFQFEVIVVQQAACDAPAALVIQ